MRCKCGSLLEYETLDPRDELCNTCYREVKSIIEQVDNKQEDMDFGYDI